MAEPAAGTARAGTATAILTRIVSDDAGFAALRPRWDTLFAEAADANTFLSFEWLHSWWVSYRVDADLRLVLAERDGILVGVAPLMIKRERLLGLSFRVAFFVGDGTWETDHMNFLVRAEGRGEILAHLLRAVEALPWDAARLNMIPDASPTAPDVLAWAKVKGWPVDVQKAVCPRRAIPESYEALLASLQSRFRSTLRSTRRKLGEKYKVEFGLHQDPAEFKDALNSLFTNHASRWAAKGQSGVFTDPRKRAFYDALVGELHARGWLRFYYLKLDGVVKAQEFCFEHEGVVFLLQEGFDYSFASDNLGNALRSHVFERLIADKAKVYDFLAGISRNKQLWGDAFPDDLKIEVARATPKGFLYFRVPKLLEKLKEIVKKMLRKSAASDAAAAGNPPE